MTSDFVGTCGKKALFWSTRAQLKPEIRVKKMQILRAIKPEIRAKKLQKIRAIKTGTRGNYLGRNKTAI